MSTKRIRCLCVIGGLYILSIFNMGSFLKKEPVVVSVEQEEVPVKSSSVSEVSIDDVELVIEEPCNIPMWVISDCEVYENCDGTGNVIGILNKDSSVTVLGTLDNGFSHISNGYVSSSKLTGTNPIINICENDGVDPSWVDKINKSLEVLPNSLKAIFINSGWHMYCTTMNIDNVYYGGRYGAVMATTNYYENRILIECRTDAVEESPVHEFGHFIDYYLGFTTDTSEYMSIYNSSERSSFCSYYNVSFYFDNKELFAEGFWKYFTDPDGLRTCSPSLYSYIEGVVNSL